MRAPTRLPLALKLAYTAWFVAFVPIYWHYHGPANYLWFCDISVFIVAFALWTESRLWLGSQAVGGLFIQLYWTIDYLGRLLFGDHPFGGTEYMFDATQALWLRSFSLFHIGLPILLLWTVYRLGYDRRSWKLQTLLAWIILPLSMLPDPERNINWVWRPFGIDQTLMPPAAYLVVCMIAYPLILYLPAHALLEAWMRRADRPVF